MVVRAPASRCHAGCAADAVDATTTDHCWLSQAYQKGETVNVSKTTTIAAKKYKLSHLPKVRRGAHACLLCRALTALL